MWSGMGREREAKTPINMSLTMLGLRRYCERAIEIAGRFKSAILGYLKIA
jgi:hypothetical protein